MSAPHEIKEHLTLRWGVPKSWRLRPANLAILQRYAALGWEWSVAAPTPTPERKVILCELIDAISAETIRNDWEGTDMTKEEAKKYVMEYRR